jgi:hypothetical protein
MRKKPSNLTLRRPRFIVWKLRHRSLSAGSHLLRLMYPEELTSFEDDWLEGGLAIWPRSGGIRTARILALISEGRARYCKVSPAPKYFPIKITAIGGTESRHSYTVRQDQEHVLRRQQYLDRGVVLRVQKEINSRKNRGERLSGGRIVQKPQGMRRRRVTSGPHGE